MTEEKADVPFIKLVAVFIKTRIKENLDLLKRILGGSRCYVYVARLIAALTICQISSILAAKDCTNHLLKIPETDICQRTGEYSRK